MSESLANDLLLRVCRREKVARTPIWIMRQAGRYLPEYQAVREKADFMTMCRTPELAAEVTLQPVDIIGVDAAIIFSDILVVPQAMGMELNFYEGKGPVFANPLKRQEDFHRLRPVNPEHDLKFVLEALQIVREELSNRVPLIGFAGAPWTLAAYMVEGHGSKNFTEIKRLMYEKPETLKTLLDKLAVAVADFLNAQIKAGAQVVQLFDSWAGMLPPDAFRVFSLPYIEKVVSRVKDSGVPIIVFAKDAGHSFGQLSQIGADVLSVSWTEELTVAGKRVNGNVALQGNLDPTVLFAPTVVIKQEVLKVLEKAKGYDHIFNLGHGILPQTPVENAKALVQFVKEESVRFH